MVSQETAVGSGTLPGSSGVCARSGNGGRGQYLIRELLRIGGVEIAGVCDIYDVRRDQAAQIAGPTAEKYHDYHPMIERKDIDAVIVATPDHWHAPAAVDALNAGKDVYVEKPMVHTPADGQAIVKAVRANKRVLQVGMQGRGMKQFVECKQRFVDTGVMGKTGFARTWYLSNSGYVQEAPKGFERKPDGLDWDRWLGRGPKIAWDPGVYFSPYKWLHYDGGMIMGIGIHVVDTAHYMLNLKAPASCVAGGGIHFYNDGRDTPDVITFIVEYPEKLTVTFTAECLSAPGVRTSAGVELRGTGGVNFIERYSRPGEVSWTYKPNAKFSKTPEALGEGSGPSAEVILKDWLESIKSRKQTICNAETAYYSTMACYMALEAYRTKGRVTWQSDWDLPA
ncbi:MAG TPA: Gfo/Idh/MocA family oxidoreductase [Bryobacteraceae bacterium]|nr:Gfo/Idh/MocA family oxidoreductase [Bryobacteraceae bacterium]